MTLENDAKFKEKLTCGLKNHMRNLENIHQSTWKSQSVTKMKNDAKFEEKFTEDLCLMALKIDTIFEGKLTFAF